jgi:protein subunit release factor A
MLGSVRPVRTLFFTMDNAIIAQLERIRSRFNELTDEMARPEIADFEQSNKLARERAEVEDVSTCSRTTKLPRKPPTKHRPRG